MDRSTLVEMQIGAGAKLLDQLVKEGFPLTAAAWLKEAENGMWYLYVVTPLVGKDRATEKAYKQLLRIFRTIMPRPGWLDSQEIRAIGPTSPIAKALLDVAKLYPDFNGGPIRWGGTTIGHLTIDGTYLYPLPAPAAATPESQEITPNSK